MFSDFLQYRLAINRYREVIDKIKIKRLLVSIN